LKHERWGSPLVQEKYREEKVCDRRHAYRIIIIIIIIIIKDIFLWLSKGDMKGETKSEIIVAQIQALQTENIASVKIENSRQTQPVLLYIIDWLHVSTLWGHHQGFAMNHFVKKLRTFLGSQTVFTNGDHV